MIYKLQDALVGLLYWVTDTRLRLYAVMGTSFVIALLLLWGMRPKRNRAYTVSRPHEDLPETTVTDEVIHSLETEMA